jgi:hypothetical protein
MSPPAHKPLPEEVDTLLRNAELRDQLEPYRDESLDCLNLRHLPTPLENDYLASMLAWERAPMLPIAEWFNPPLRLPHPDTLSDRELHEALWDAIHRLYSVGVVLEFTDHLDDRQLYRLILRDILPSVDKKIDVPPRYVHWDCADASGDVNTWLRYYASSEERRNWAKECPGPLPPPEDPRYRRELPKAPR